MVNIKIASTLNVPGVEMISDTQKSYTISPEKEYILNFIDGGITMRAFKELLLLNKNILFYVVNFEFFVYEMRQFKYCCFEFVSYPDEEADQRIEKYKNIEILLSGKCSERGIQVSFEPNVFASIRSSLMRPELYLSRDSISTMIYKALDKKIKYDELREQVQKDWGKCMKIEQEKTRIEGTRMQKKRKTTKNVNSADDGEVGYSEEFNLSFDKSLKSLLFTDVVKMKDELFFRWNP